MTTGLTLLQRYGRCLGRIDGNHPGPLIISVGGIHGNEPAGVLALERVVQTLDRHPEGFCGTFVAFIGNVDALNKGRRYIRQDLNRLWTTRRIESLRNNGNQALRHEEKECLELFHNLEPLLRGERETYLLDLHTTSSSSIPFVIAGSNPTSHRFTYRFPLPVIIGLEREIGTTLTDYAATLGIHAVALEAGHHADALSVDFHEAILWTALSLTGSLNSKMLPQVEVFHEKLKNETARLPRRLKVFYRHLVRPEDHFRMAAGFRNLQVISEGEVLGHDIRGDVVAPARGHLVLPLYQKQGDDGFFMAQAGTAGKGS